ncbi:MULTISPECIES: hypothetical protein [Rhodopseudomonas]|uniref:hypothetical protein n=1 Tax=Rhodopseudomonas TaxID=1073 RepID=UPI00069728AC|nr:MULTISPECIES: hypothetical protein [Rhodopseudomonas]MDF3810818.1 hypothetical protein [Rhodopseudomonas sp. BAL398]WOK20079.1 hypothetical protein RBJ75_11430 [Rhodopseudomonas sp. BAL398]
MTSQPIDDLQPGPPSPTWRSGFRDFLMDDWPYLSMLALALFGVAYTSISETRAYWIALAPFIGLICVVTGWDVDVSKEARWRLVLTQILHWSAVLVTMVLMPVTNVSVVSGGNLGALSALTLVALGTFTAGVHTSSWRIALVGLILAASVPGIELLQQSALLILMVVVVLTAAIAPFVWHARKSKKAASEPEARPVEPAPDPVAPSPQEPADRIDDRLASRADVIDAPVVADPSYPEPGTPARQAPPFS